MDFNELLRKCPPAERDRIKYFTKDAFGDIYAHAYRPYTFDKHWRSPEGPGILVGSEPEGSSGWQASLVTQPSSLGVFEGPVWALGSALAIVTIVWVYFAFIWNGQKQLQLHEAEMTESAVVSQQVGPVNRDMRPLGAGD